MAFKSALLRGNARLDNAANGGPSIKQRPPDDDKDAVARIQKALLTLGYPLPGSFPNGPAGEPDGIFGPETYRTLIAFQKKQFPGQPGQWDGRAGPNTLGRMDELLPAAGGDDDGPGRGRYFPLARVRVVSDCKIRTPRTA